VRVVFNLPPLFLTSPSQLPLSLLPWAHASAAAPHLSLLPARHYSRNTPDRAIVTSSAGFSSGVHGASYLDMWTKAVERERWSAELAHRFQAPTPAEAAAAPPVDVVERRTTRFEDLLRVPREECDRVQCRQVIDRTADSLVTTRRAQGAVSIPDPVAAAIPAPKPAAVVAYQAARGASAAMGDPEQGAPPSGSETSPFLRRTGLRDDGHG
jgi:hypothetical protein